jgi:hypothetical protein
MDNLVRFHPFLVAEEQDQEEELAGDLQDAVSMALFSRALQDLESSSVPSEDFGLSQFWYDEPTALELALAALDSGAQRIAFLSCPSAFKAALSLNALRLHPADLWLFEFDARLGKSMAGDKFVLYDFQQDDAAQIPMASHHVFDLVMVDPPYLNQDCLGRFLETARLIGTPQKKLIVSTGAVMEDFLSRCDEGLYLVRDRPRHASKLGNEFCTWTSFDPSPRLGGWE